MSAPSSTFNWDQRVTTSQKRLKNDGVTENKIRDTPSFSSLFYLVLELYRLSQVKAICRSDELREVRRSSSKLSDTLIAWLDERSLKGGSRKKTNGLVSAGAMYAALKLPRFCQNINTNDENQLPDAQRRLIYIPDPTALSLAHVILGASSTEVPILRDFFWEYLKAQTSVRVGFTGDGRMFMLQFHLSFFIWKKHNILRKDSRRRSDGTALRNSIDLSILRKARATPESGITKMDCLYEAQVSCLIAGHNNKTWVGYGLVDTFFHGPEDEDEDRDSIRHYKSEQGKDHPTSHANMDPITAGKFDADIPIWNPREYFLVVLRVRVEQVGEEWQKLVLLLRENVENYIQGLRIRSSVRDNAIGGVQEQSEALRLSYEWARSVSRLLDHLIKTLHRTTDAWSVFVSSHNHHFRDASIPGESLRRHEILFQQMENTFGELHDALRDLKHLDDMLRNFRLQSEFYFEVEKNSLIVLQQWNITFMHVVTPPSLAAAVVQSGIEPFQPVWCSFLFMTVTFALAPMALRPAMEWYWRRFHQISPEHESKFTLVPAYPQLGDLGGAQVPFPQPTFSLQGWRILDVISCRQQLAKEFEAYGREAKRIFCHRLLPACRIKDLVSKSGLVIRLTGYVKDLARPRVRKGHRRINWTCECGERLYADFDGRESMAWAELQATLWPAGCSTAIGEHPHRDRARNGHVPDQSAVSPSWRVFQALESSSGMPKGDQSPSSRNDTSLSEASTSVSANDIDNPDKRFVELCVNTGEFERRLGEVDITNCKSDADFFARIKAKYDELRGFRAKFFLLKPIDVHFVQFSLEDRYRVGILDKPLAIPSAEDMQKDGYGYHPCPLKPPPVPTHIFLHFLLKSHPGACLIWGRRIPQKLNRSILQFQTSQNELVTGWGIHIIEGLNKATILMLTLVILLTSGVVSVAWAVIRDDPQGGFGIGAWLTGVLAVILLLVLTRWNDL